MFRAKGMNDSVYQTAVVLTVPRESNCEACRHWGKNHRMQEFTEGEELHDDANDQDGYSPVHILVEGEEQRQKEHRQVDDRGALHKPPPITNHNYNPRPVIKAHVFCGMNKGNSRVWSKRTSSWPG